MRRKQVRFGTGTSSRELSENRRTIHVAGNHVSSDGRND
jgi:hypothetical protein